MPDLRDIIVKTDGGWRAPRDRRLLRPSYAGSQEKAGYRENAVREIPLAILTDE
jgi:hypothetical protein